jgi:capsular polysaccharide biosynthesis protein
MTYSKLWHHVPGIVKRTLHPLLRQIYLLDYVLPEQSLVRSIAAYLLEQPVVRSTAIQNVRTLAAAETVTLASPHDDPFVPIGKYYREGSFVRPRIFVCDVPDAALHIGSGMVCTRDMEVLADFEYRVTHYPQIRKRKPRNLKRLTGTYSTVNSCYATNIGHWWIDCLPRILSLAKVEPKSKITLLMPVSLGAVHRESLESVLPSNFVVEYHPDTKWLRLEKFLWPSMASGRCNYFLPAEYNEFMRRPIFKRFNLPARHSKTARIYISRSRARWRRVLNEKAVCALLVRYGFKVVDLEDLSFREQVELFHQAEIVVGPHGAGLNTIMFSGDIHIVVLYSTQVPQNYFHTQAIGLGQKHHFLTASGGEDDDFEVDIPALEQLLKNELNLKACF